jgi:hypothetical protein
MAQNKYANSVFINCPFDAQYRPLFEAIVFGVLDCGFRPRCALEIDDASQVRIDKVFKLIAESKYGIHDISRTEITSAGALPRFNMPLEKKRGRESFRRERSEITPDPFPCLRLTREHPWCGIFLFPKKAGVTRFACPNCREFRDEE